VIKRRKRPPGGEPTQPPAVIEAKAQLKNLQLEATRFVPTGVKMRMERGLPGAVIPSPASHQAPSLKPGQVTFRVQREFCSVFATALDLIAPWNTRAESQRAKAPAPAPAPAAAAKTSDDAYEDFMNQMKHLLWFCAFPLLDQ